LLSLPIYYPSSMHLGALFMWQDVAFLEKYRDHFPKSRFLCVSQHYQMQQDKNDNNSTEENVKDKTLKELLQEPEGDKILFDVIMRNLKEFSAEDRAKKVSEMMDLNSGPDVVVPVQNTSNLSQFELESINYVIKRYMAAAIKKTTDEVLLNCTSIIYRMSHPINMLNNSAELDERMVSILMGYPYPYSFSEQPRALRHLSLDVVIPFLHRHVELLKWDHQPQVGQDLRCTSQETLVYESKIVQGIYQLLNQRQGSDTEKEAKSWVKSWYLKWEVADHYNDTNQRRNLVHDIKNFLLKIRYMKQERRKENLMKDICKWKDIINKWERVNNSLDSFKVFMDNYGGALMGNQELSPEHKALKPMKKALETRNIADEDYPSMPAMAPKLRCKVPFADVQ